MHLAPLVERVFLPVSGEPPRAVAFVGVGAPSHAITATTAELLATVDAVRVCIVDANFTAPSLHERFGVANDGEVFIAADRPYGLIEASVLRDDASDPGPAWTDIRAFL